MVMTTPDVRLSPSGRDLGGLGQWNLLYRRDFTAEPSQVLSGDGAYVIGDVQWTKAGSANELEQTRLVNGTGIVFCPLSGLTLYTSAHTAPRLTVPMADVVADVTRLTSELPLRVQARCSASGPYTAYADVGVGIEYVTGANNFVVATRLFQAGAAVGGQCFERNQSGLITVMTNAASLPAADVPCLWLPRGVGGLDVRYGRGQWVGPWPTWPTIPFCCGWSPDNERWALLSWPAVGILRNWDLVLYAQNQIQAANTQLVVESLLVEGYY